MNLILWISFFLCLAAEAFDWQGHRGARGLYPENTIGAMEVALRYPVTTLELDVVISKDLEVVVSHEPWMSPEICQHPQKKTLRDRDFNLFKMTYKEIEAFDCGSLGHPRFPEQRKVAERKPTLKKLLEVIEEKLRREKRTVLYSIEIKSTPEDEKEGFQPDVPRFSDLVMKSILQKLPVDRFMIQSFDWRVLRYLHEKYPKIKLVALTEGPFEVAPNLKELGFMPIVFSPEHTHLTKQKVQELHREKVLVIPWTVNETRDMKVLMEMGVDGIITDYPDRLIPAAGHRFYEIHRLVKNSSLLEVLK